MGQKGDAYTIRINFKKLAQLLIARITSINKSRKNKIAVKSVAVYEHMMQQYFRTIFNQAIQTTETITFPFIGNLQVIQKISKKGWDWDQKYKGKDFELVIDTKKKVAIKIDDKWYPKILRSVERGKEYRVEVINHSERLNEILSLLHDDRAVRKSPRRTNKVTT